ncbi:hypothetical protein D9613_001090 [Agrocybe pediades]|uniref:BTB domain-containing protein n=1 Tax=Agrocybe pediades TaxID=84607 RepID=A0A8H4VSW9_9AGAR|nr:hypothetical protein D9613_001090 [Agrocybe pediades]
MESTISIATPTPVLREFFNTYNMATIYVKVEDTTFSIPRHVLNHPGSPFEMMFKLPQPGDEERKEAASEQDPLVLEGIVAHDFEAFLHVLYPLPDNAPPPKFNVGSEDYWLGILKLATMWRYGKLHEKAVQQMKSIVAEKTPLEMIYLGRKYSMPAWVKDGYVALCSQEHLKPEELAEPPTSDFALDWKTIATLLYVWGYQKSCTWPVNRECSYCRAYYRTSSELRLYCDNCNSTESTPPHGSLSIPDLISQYFRQELSGLDDNFDL